MTPAPVQRVIAYIDGFNVYHGLRAGRLRRFYWLDLRRLSQNLLRPPQTLVFTKYFTARISGAWPGDPPDRARHLNAERKRQSDFLEALDTLPDFKRYDGHFLGKAVTCRACGASWRTHEEKMTDVQIATELLTDAFQDRFDTALLMSADSDLVPPTLAVQRIFRKKRIVVAFPPSRVSVELGKAASAHFTIGRRKLAVSQFPDEVKKADGFVLRRPAEWR
jgi:uncharacterized LabA/DUF88 family protein